MNPRIVMLHSKIEIDCSGDQKGDEHYSEPEDSDKMFHHETSENHGEANDEELDNSSKTSFFFKMRKVMFKSMVSLAVGVAFLAILFSVWGVQFPFAEGQKMSHIGNHAVFNRKFAPSGWGTSQVSDFCKEIGRISRTVTALEEV